MIVLILLACSSKPPDCAPNTWYLDEDGDGWGGTSLGASCVAPASAVGQSGDCADQDPSVHPGAEDLCDGVDNDCDGDPDPPGDVWYTDADGDGFGNAAAPVESCAQPEGAVADATDCDDGHADAFPGAEEVWYDGVDQDCLGGSDHDADGDGYDAASGKPAWPDCDDDDPLVNPGAEEVCGDGLDNDCDLETACALAPNIELEDAAWLGIGVTDHSWYGGAVGVIGDSDGDGLDEFSFLIGRPAEGDSRRQVRQLQWAGGEFEERIVVQELSEDEGTGDFLFGPWDIDGDGLDDLVAQGGTSVPGAELHVYFGPLSERMNSSMADLRVTSSLPFDSVGSAASVTTIADERKLLFGGRMSDPGDTLNAGELRSVRLDEDQSSVDVSVSDWTASGDLESMHLGIAVAWLDIDADGVDDVVGTILGNMDEREPKEEVPSQVVTWLAVGSDEVNWRDHDGSRVAGDYSYLCAPMAVVSDADGDGVDDLWCGEFFNGEGGRALLYSGALLGARGGRDEGLLLSLLPEDPDEALGVSVASGDINGDGEADLLASSPGAAVDGRPDAGTVCIVYGPANGAMTVGDCDAVIVGEEDAALGQSLASGVDGNGDGCDDIFVGSPSAELEGGYSRGLAALFLGSCI